MFSPRRRLQHEEPSSPASATALLDRKESGVVQAAFVGPRSGLSAPNESPYVFVNSSNASIAPSVSDKFSLSPDPLSWGVKVEPNFEESDDYLHNPDPRRDRNIDRGGTIFTSRGLANVGFLAFLAVGLMTFFAGYPLISHFTANDLSTLGGFNIGGINASGQIPDVGNFGLIDKDTPKEAYTKASYVDGATLELVFSDEFNTDGRTFYAGDDPYWEAVNLHYWGTNNLEWYDPAAITTRDGALEITLSKSSNHDLTYQGGMLSTWNKFCFTGGLLEVSVVLPGKSNVTGLWPALWTMGNLGRAGYGASLDGMWPYTYDACDVGTVSNQTKNGLPVAAAVSGNQGHGSALSYLPGQRLSRCTCPGESHPGPVHSDGTYAGRAAPEIDVFEAQVSAGSGEASQSLQLAPFNNHYEWFDSSDNMIFFDPSITRLNPYRGGIYQQAASGVTKNNQGCYERNKGCFSTYAVEYKSGYASDNAYVLWVNDGKAVWRANAAGFAADTKVEISDRPIPQEPMYIIANLGMSKSFGDIDFENLTFPTTMRVDWIRVYQRLDEKNIGCDPKDFPTQAYIKEYIEAYTNPNLTTWVDDYGQTIPRNSFLGEC